MVILLGGSEQDISMFLDTPRLRDEPRDEEGRDDGLLRIFFYYSYGYTTGFLGTRLSLRRGENAPALRMLVRLPRTDYTGIFEDVVMASLRKNAPALRMTVRMPRTMREQWNRDSSARRVTRYAEPAASKQYGVEVAKKENWTRGND